MYDRFNLDLFNEKEDYFSPQEISDKLYSIENLRLVLNFGEHLGKKYREQSLQNWIEVLPKLKKVKRLILMYPKSQEFFEAACKLTQLQSLILSSLKIDNLLPLSNVKILKTLHIDSCHQLKSISPIIDLKEIVSLCIENCYNIEDLELLGQLTSLEALRLTGDSTAPKRLRLHSLKPFSNLKKLKHLDLSTTSVVDKSYEVLLDLPALERFDTTSNIKASLVNDIKSKHKNLKAGFFVDWDYERNIMSEGKQW